MSHDSTAWLFGAEQQPDPPAKKPDRAAKLDSPPGDSTRPATGGPVQPTPPKQARPSSGDQSPQKSGDKARQTPAGQTRQTREATPGGSPPARGPRKAGKPRAAPAGKGALSPMMQQFMRAKQEVGDALLFFRMGDFYELFHEDAVIASRVLGLTLTSRSKGEGAIPMAGMPHKAHEKHLHTLIRNGYRVAICDQVEDPATAKGLVDRRVTRIITAGTVYEDDLLDRGSSNFLLSIFPADDDVGLAWLDVSTGAFTVARVPRERLADEVSRLDPAEILMPESLLHAPGELVAEVSRASPAPRVPGLEWTFQSDNAAQTLQEVLGVTTLEGFGLAPDSPCVCAAGAALAYVRHTQRGEAPPVSGLTVHDGTSRAGLDRATRSCLELLVTQRTGQREGSLLSVLDATGTAMGARLLREWIVMPLIDPAEILARQSAVAELVDNTTVCDQVSELLDSLPDIERIATRLLAGRGSPRDLAGLRAALQTIPRLTSALTSCASAPLAQAGANIQPLPELQAALEGGLAEHPPVTLGDGGLIAPGWNAELDELRHLRENGATAIANFQAEEAARLGLPSLKVAYNKVFGYYMEITHVQAAQVQIPEHYVRKQTLTSAERYINSELKELETSILTAEERSRRLESELFLELRAQAGAQGNDLRRLSVAVAELDVLTGFARIARERGWVRPAIDDSLQIEIDDGRHPVLDALLPAGELVPNDLELSHDGARLVLITGPNMAGKSTYIRQAALLVLLAQMGSFLPARSARIGVVDRIFTRVGAADDLSSGSSTFMVEMTETAAILNGATERSLVILDEVGRGTSTWDGLSLAWAISEYLYKRIGARTLFATHYHELVDLADEFEGVRNVNVAVKEWGDEIVFQHKIVPGGTDRSYGLHVARLAGVPGVVIDRARHVLRDLENSAPDLRPGAARPRAGETPAGASEPEPVQKALYPRPVAAVMDEIRSLDVDQISPMEALLLLRSFTEKLELPGADDSINPAAEPPSTPP